jgi:HD-GYP domain-containing protein (c-di-GMP phosphodiesterase class II)
MRKLLIAKGLAFPIDIASQATCLFGIRGSGKTNTAGAFAEELLDNNYPIAVIDPTDAWWGMRAGRDGSQKGGYPIVIFGGAHADLPLTEYDGKLIAEFLVREQVPVILSLRHLRKAAQRRFVTEFCEELYHLKGKDENRTPLTVFIDEAPLFVPQKVMGEVARTVGAVEDLIARGRNSGFGVVLISQRSATLNADVRTQADTIICHRLTAPLDRKAIAAWFEENASTDDLKTILQSLATLKNGEAWVWSPSLDIMSRTQIRLRRTFDSSATPKAGMKVRPPKTLADVDLDKLKGQLAASIEKAKENDPKELRKRIAQLEREVKAKPGKAPPAPKVKRVEVSIITATDRKLLTRASDQAEKAAANAADLASKVAVLSARVDRAAGQSTAGDIGGPLAKLALSVPLPKPPSLPKLFPLASVKQSNATDGELGKGERATLIAIAQHPNGVTREQLTILTGYKRSTRDTYIQRLRTAELVALVGDTLMVTSVGTDYAPLPTGAALREHWLAKLPEGERKILELLCAAHPYGVSRDQLSEKTGYARSSRDTYLQRLRARKLVVTEGRGTVLASEALFS